jgi:hypothetical protein
MLGGQYGNNTTVRYVSGTNSRFCLLHKNKGIIMAKWKQWDKYDIEAEVEARAIKKHRQLSIRPQGKASKLKLAVFGGQRR